MATEHTNAGDGPPLFIKITLAAIVVWLGWKVIDPGARVAPVEQRRAEARVKIRETVEADAKALHTAAWVDKEKGVVRLPIADAKCVVLAELAQKKPAPSQIKADPLPPLPPPYDPASKEPPVPSLPNAPGGAVTMQFAANPAPAAPAPAAQPPAPPAPPAAPARPPIINSVPAPAPPPQPNP